MPTPTHALWATIPPQLANDILLAVQKGNKKLYRTALEVMAPRMGIRVPLLIETQTPMLCAWLDSLGIEHGPNGCADNFPPEPAAAVIKKGIDTLLAKFDPTIVIIYLRSFNQIDETQWPVLDEVLRTDARLQPKAEPVASA